MRSVRSPAYGQVPCGWETAARFGDRSWRVRSPSASTPRSRTSGRGHSGYGPGLAHETSTGTTSRWPRGWRSRARRSSFAPFAARAPGSRSPPDRYRSFQPLHSDAGPPPRPPRSRRPSARAFGRDPGLRDEPGGPSRGASIAPRPVRGAARGSTSNRLSVSDHPAVVRGGHAGRQNPPGRQLPGTAWARRSHGRRDAGLATDPTRIRLPADVLEAPKFPGSGRRLRRLTEVPKRRGAMAPPQRRAIPKSPPESTGRDRRAYLEGLGGRTVRARRSAGAERGAAAKPGSAYPAGPAMAGRAVPAPGRAVGL